MSLEIFFHVLKILGIIAVCFVGFIALNLLAMWQATWGMSQEEKDRFFKYIEENGILGHDDDFWP